jgi:Mn-dependent DtxR family transcriptional regulator
MDSAELTLTPLEQDAKRSARLLREMGPRITPWRVARVLFWSEAYALETLRCLVEHGLAVRVGTGRFTLTELGHSRALEWSRAGTGAT